MCELTPVADLDPILVQMLITAVRNGSAPIGGVVRLRLIDRTDQGDKEVTISVSTDEARTELKKRGLL